MLIAQAAAAPAMTIGDWAQFGLGGAVIFIMSWYIWHQTKAHTLANREHNQTIESISTASNATATEITNKFIVHSESTAQKFIEHSEKTNDRFIKLHEDTLSTLRKRHTSDE